LNLGHEDGRQPKKGRYVALVLALLLLVTFALVLFNRHGFLSNRQLELQMQETAREVNTLRTELDSLERLIERLQFDSLYMETMVREVLGWGRPGEHIVRFVAPQ
jgi:cell division protein FtsB